MIKEALSFLFWLIVAAAGTGLAIIVILCLGWSIAIAWHWLFKPFLPWRVAIGLTAILTPLTLYGMTLIASNWRPWRRKSGESSIVLK